MAPISLIFHSDAFHSDAFHLRTTRIAIVVNIMYDHGNISHDIICNIKYCYHGNIDDLLYNVVRDTVIPTIFLSLWLPNKGNVCVSVFCSALSSQGVATIWWRLLVWRTSDHRIKYLVHAIHIPHVHPSHLLISTHTHTHFPTNLMCAQTHTHTHTHTAAVNYPTAAAEILDILELQMALLTGGRDRQGKSLITFPAKPKTFTYDRDDVRKVIQYLTSIPTYVVLVVQMGVACGGTVMGCGY